MILDNLKNKISDKLKIASDVFTYPPNIELGHLSLPIFSLAKDKKNNLNDLASEIKKQLEEDEYIVVLLEKIITVGPYLNFFLKKDLLFSDSLNLAVNSIDSLTFNDFGNQEVLVYEYANVNTHKELHIGHLRNLVLGNVLYKIALANNYDAHSVSFVNDFGINTAKTVWYYKDHKDKNIAQCYSSAVQAIEKNPDLNNEITEIMQSIESKSGQYFELWKETREMSIKDFDNVYNLLNIQFEKTYYESELIEEGLDLVSDYLNKAILEKSEGAIIANLEQYNLGVQPFIRTNGTALYPVADLALAKAKVLDFPNLAKSFIVVDVRQSLHFKQLFKVLELAGYKNDFSHLSYDFVKLPEGMLSSRSGSALSFDDFFNQLVTKIKLETKSRHENWDEDKIDEHSLKLSLAILKFEMLKVSPNKVITFNIDEALKFDGFSALYILYGLVRIKSILRKADFNAKAVDLNHIQFKLDSDLEQRLLLEILKYKKVLALSYQDVDPSEIAKYLFNFVKIFNDYYQNTPILNKEDDLKNQRLILLYSCSLIMEKALEVLGIESLEEL